MKIFISWSKEHSHEYALAFRNWLPSVIQSAEPFISSQDIALGDRGIDEIESRLNAISFGVLFVSSENYREPWLLYEAGALSRAIEQADVRVIPILIDINRAQLSGSPLSHFQNAESVMKDTFKKLCIAINDATAEPLNVERLERSFEKWWPDLEDDFGKVKLPTTKKENVTLESLRDGMLEMGKAIVDLRNNERQQTDLLIRRLSQSDQRVYPPLSNNPFAKIGSGEMGGITPSRSNLNALTPRLEQIDEHIERMKSQLEKLEKFRREVQESNEHLSGQFDAID